jgi:hypothetical protein
MGLLLLFLCCSLLRHLSDIRPEEMLLLVGLGAAISYAIFVAWRAVRNAR